MVKPVTKNMFGLLEVKITARVRKRGFTPWKAWKKQWCHLKKSTKGVELCVYSTVPLPGVVSIPMQTVYIPDSCVCYRTDSRTKSFAFGLFLDSKSRKALMYLAGFSESNSQEWINAIRKALDKRQNSIINIPDVQCSYTVSLIDNAHSRAAGLFGVYGEMTVTPAGLIIHQPNGKLNLEENVDRFCINWNQILQCHMSDKRGGEDERRICIVHTNELFPNGPGQLRFFCLQAPKLLHSIMTQCNTILTTKLSTTKQLSNCVKNMKCASGDSIATESVDISRCPQSYLKSPCHRISRSEGDLCGYCDSDRDSGWSSCSPPEYNSILSTVEQQNFTGDDIRLSMSSDDTSFIMKGKVADSLISTGLLLSSLGKSSNDIFHSIDLMNSLPDINEQQDIRRVSGVSIASGVYEEILEGSSQPLFKPLSALYEEPIYMPPPLPPRGRYTSHTSTSDDGIDEDECDCSTPVTSKFMHPHFCHSEIVERTKILANSSPNVNTIQQDMPIRKLSVPSVQILGSIDSNYENSSGTKCSPALSRKAKHFIRSCESNNDHVECNKEIDFIPRCNTEPQQSLRLSQHYISNVLNGGDAIRKNKNRFDLTPIRNKLNNFIKSYSDNDNSPKSRSYFYNSLPRSININRVGPFQKTPSKHKIHKDGTARSCEMLEPDMIETMESDKIVRSCEQLDCVTPSFSKKKPLLLHDDVYEQYTPERLLIDTNIKHNTHKQFETDSIFSKDGQTYANCDILQENIEDISNIPSTSVASEPNFSKMRYEWAENKNITNLVDYDYVPMSPGIASNTCEENDYMDMTGTKGKNIVSTAIINGSPKFDYSQI